MVSPRPTSARLTRCLGCLMVLAVCVTGRAAESASASLAGQLVGPEHVSRASKNFVPNGDFEAPKDGGQTEGTWFLDNSTKLAGNYSLSAKGSPARAVRKDERLPLEIGETYTLSAWMKGEDLQTVGPSHGSVGVKVIDAGWHWCVSLSPEQPTSDWKRYSVTFTAPPTTHRGKQIFALVFFVPKGETGRIWLDNVQVERGGHVTDFTAKAIPDLKRVVSQLNEANAVLNGMSAAQARLRPNTKALAELRGRSGAMRAEITAAADQAGEFATLEDAVWKQTVETATTASAKLRDLAWHTWWTNPWSRYSRRQAPTSLGQAPAKTMRLAVNDYDAAALMVTNLSDASVEMRVGLVAEGDPSQSPSTPPWAKLRVARMVSPSYEPAAEYPSLLASLDDSQSLTVPPSETTQLWIDVDTYGMEPGTHSAQLELVPYRGLEPQTIPFTVEVADLTLPEKCPAEVFCWGLNPLEKLGEKADMTQEQINAIQDPWLKDFARHGINRMLHHTQTLNAKFKPDGSLSRPLNFLAHDKHLAAKRRYTSNFVGGYSVAHYYMPGLDEAPEVFEKRFASLMEAWIAHLRGLGITPDECPLELFDEPSGEKLIRNRLAHKVLKQVAPDWKTVAAISIDTPDGLESVAPMMDIMVVNPDLNEACDEVLRDSGREIWTYVCEGSLGNLKPYQYYRLLPWKTWRKGYAGFGFYWTMKRMTTPRENRYSPFYYGNAGPVPSRGWQAFWRGTRDWAYLHTLREAIKTARNQGRDEAAKRAEDTLQEAVAEVVGNPADEARADAWRARVLNRLVELASA